MRNSLMRPCIWCLKNGRSSVEHIIPEVLGCPPGFVLKRGEVCKDCNSNTLSQLDTALGESFDILRVLNRVPGKRKKSPKVTGRTNLRGHASRKGHIVLQLNMENNSVDSDIFGAIPPPGGSYRDVHGTFTREGQICRSTLTAKIGGHPDFSRALHKIALEWFVKLTSWDNVLDERFNVVREYVLNNLGSREVLMFAPESWSYRHEFPSIIWNDKDGSPIIQFILCGFPFLISLDRDNQSIEAIKREALHSIGSRGWTTLPVNSSK
jgi:hypothetical protein